MQSRLRKLCGDIRACNTQPNKNYRTNEAPQIVLYHVSTAAGKVEESGWSRLYFGEMFSAFSATHYLAGSKITGILLRISMFFVGCQVIHEVVQMCVPLAPPVPYQETLPSNHTGIASCTQHIAQKTILTF